jgi:hypothetical protein
LLAVCSRQSLSFSAIQYCAVVNRVREWRANHEGSKRSEDGSECGRGFIRDVESIAEVLKLCVPSAAVELLENGEEGPCPVHGKRNVRDLRLALQLVGRLGFGRSDDACVVLEAGGGDRNVGANDDDDDGGGGGSSRVCSLVDMLIGSIRRCAAIPWLVPVNRCYFEAERRGLALVLREGGHSCLSFVLGNADCVASGSRRRFVFTILKVEI